MKINKMKINKINNWLIASTVVLLLCVLYLCYCLDCKTKQYKEIVAIYSNMVESVQIELNILKDELK